ncbi:MAG: NAD(+) synthase [Deltaproteobacteria bacterium]|nr:NAD(+) synthase [Deltaproteobacteria bacterium]
MPAESFLDVRNHGFARVAVCVPETRVGDPDFNAAAHLRVLTDAHAAGAHYAVCPELGLTAYTCGDLFFQSVLQERAVAALAAIAADTAAWNMVVSVGLPLAVGGMLFNCAVTLAGGRVLAVAPKAYPPNYREFYELRWFQPAAHATARDLEVLGRSVPFGTDVLIELPHLPGFVLHTDVCEDLWVPIPPGARAALAGATVLANLSASNLTVGKHEYRRDLVRLSSAKNLAVQLYSAAGFGESTADLAWDGHGIVADRGEIVAETPRFTLTGSAVLADVDLAALATDRLRMSSFGHNADRERAPYRTVAAEPVHDARAAAPFRRLRRDVAPRPFVPSDPAARDARCRDVFDMLCTSLARRLRALPADRRIVLGVSGGQDSTLALLAAVRTMDLLRRPRADVIGVMLPGFGTSARTHGNARALITALDATPREIDIRTIASSMFDAVGHDPGIHDVTYENVQAWTRKFLLFTLASEESAIDLGTSDLSELALGWSTYGGDHMSHYAINAGVPKTLVSELIRWAGDTVFADDPQTTALLRDVLATPISPELLPPAGEEITQHTELVVGPYELHDFFLYYFLRFGFAPRRVARLALHAFDGRFTLAEIRRWLLVFLTRVFANQFKRDCVPGSPKIGSGGSLSPRGDWRMPADASPEIWLADARAIPETVER